MKTEAALQLCCHHVDSALSIPSIDGPYAEGSPQRLLNYLKNLRQMQRIQVPAVTGPIWITHCRGRP